MLIRDFMDSGESVIFANNSDLQIQSHNSQSQPTLMNEMRARAAVFNPTSEMSKIRSSSTAAAAASRGPRLFAAAVPDRPRQSTLGGGGDVALRSARRDAALPASAPFQRRRRRHRGAGKTSNATSSFFTLCCLLSVCQCRNSINIQGVLHSNTLTTFGFSASLQSDADGKS